MGEAKQNLYTVLLPRLTPRVRDRPNNKKKTHRAVRPNSVSP